MAQDSVIEAVASYISGSKKTVLPDDVIEKAKHHVLDTLAAIVSGSQLEAGRLAIKYAETWAGPGEAQVAGSPLLVCAADAAMANGMMAHADETDDSNAFSLTHPGCGIVPAALAVAEKMNATGMDFLRGVVAGYDIGCRITRVLGIAELRSKFRSTHAIGANFGAAAACASVLGLDEERVRYTFSYAAQQASGLTYWLQGQGHVEKAFVFAGMTARNGVTAAALAVSGFTAIQDPFGGERNFFDAFSPHPLPALLVEGLGSLYEIARTNIKKFYVGSPIQAPLQALLDLITLYGLRPDDVDRIVVRISSEGLRTVDNANMPDICLQYILAVTLLDGSLSFDAAHSYERMREPSIADLRGRISVVEDPLQGASENKRQGVVEVTTKDGAILKDHIVSVRGTAENPMTRDEVEEKCLGLLEPVIGEKKSRSLAEMIWSIEKTGSVRELRRLISLAR
jgi:2-methylcitrate dehydratase PrpD